MPSAKWSSAAASLLALVVACAPSSDDASPTARAVRQSIVGGSYDTAHPAVVHYLLLNGTTPSGACSGTIVANAGARATVLTAAHCFENRTVTQVQVQLGADSSAPDAAYPATSWNVFPTNTATSTDPYHDLAIIFVDNAPASLPVMPLAPLGVYATYHAGTPLVAVGYGVESATATIATKRKSLTTGFDHIWADRIDTKTPNGTVCHGDSGGALVDPNGGDHLVGVIRGHIVDPCVVGGGEASMGFYAREVATWLRANGLSVVDASLPNGALCATDADCATQACLALPTPGWTTPTTLMCHDKLANSYVCKSASQCLSNRCAPNGACAACNGDADCAGGETCEQGTCVAPAPPPGSSSGTDAGAANPSQGAPGDAAAGEHAPGAGSGSGSGSGGAASAAAPGAPAGSGGGASSDAEAANGSDDPSSSGGCSVPAHDARGAAGGAAWVGVVAVVALRRRRRVARAC